MRLTLILACFLPVTACFGDETLSPNGPADKIWRLSDLNGAPFTAMATLTFPEPGRITGEAPCNRYFAAQDAPYPSFKAGPIGATKRACPELAAERRYFDALEAATLSEEQGDTLILSNDAGPLLVFKATE